MLKESTDNYCANTMLLCTTVDSLGTDMQGIKKSLKAGVQMYTTD